MLVPIILGSDKTTITIGTGNIEYYPLYLSIGNVRNAVRHAHCNAVIPIGFLAIPKSTCLSQLINDSNKISSESQVTANMTMTLPSASLRGNYIILQYQPSSLH